MDAAFWEDAPLAGITRRNLRELLLTRSQLQELTPLIVALAGHVGREMAEALLEGCFVRLRSKDSYILRRIIATHLPPEGSCGEGSGGGGGGGPLTVEAVNPLHAAGSAMPAVQQHHGPLVIPEHKVSDSDPFTDDAAYNDHGRAELLRHQAELAAAGHHRLGVPLHLTAAAAWRRKVALAWAARLQELVSTHGIGKMVADMNDHARLEEYLEAAIDHFQPQLPGGAALGPAAAGGGTGQLQSVPAVPLQKPRKPRSPTTGCRRGEPWAEVHEEPAQRPEPAPVPPAAAAAADATAAGQGAVLTEMPAGAAPVGAVPVAAPTLEPPPVQAAAALDPAFWGSLQQAVALATGSTRQEPFQPPSNQQPAPVLQQQQQQPMGQPPHMQQQPMELPPHLQPQQQQQPMVQPPHLQQQPSMALPPHVQQQQQQPGPRPWWHLSSPTARQPSGVHAATMQRDDRHPMPAPLLLPVGCDPRNVLGQGPFGLAAGSAPPFPTAEATTEQHSPRWAGLPPLRMSGPGTGAAFPGTGSVPAPWAGSGISPQATGPPQPGSASWQAQYILEVSGLPTGTKDGELAAYFRARFPSVLFARMVSERCGAVRFGSRVDRDAAVYEENGSFFADSQLRVDVPLNEPPPTLVCLLVSGLPPDATADSTAAYFRQRYPSVLSARVVPGKAHASAFVRFGRMDEREAAIRCQSDRSRFVLAGFLLHLKVPEGEHLWMHEQGRRLSSRRGTATVADLQPASAGPGLGLVDPLADVVAAARAFSAPASPQPLLAAAEMPAAEQKQAHVASSPDGYPLMIANVGASLTPDELLAYFRERYPSVCSASLRHGLGTVRFSSDEERHRARVEMDGHILPGGRKIGTGLPAGTAAPPVDATASHSAETAEAAAAAIKVKQEKAAEELAAGSLQQQPQQAQLGRATEQHPEAETGELAQAAEPLPQPAQPFPQGAPVAMPAAQPFAAALPLHPMVGWLPTMLAGAPAPYVAAAAAAAQGMGQQQHPAFNSGLSSTGPYVCLEGGLAQACPSVPATAPTSQADVDPTVGSTGQLRSSNSNGGSVGARMPASKPSSAKEETAKTGSEPGSRSGKKGSAASSPPRQQGSKRCRDRSHSRGRSRGRSRSSLRPQKSSRRSRSRGRSRSPSRRQDIRRPRSPVQAQPKGRGGSGWRSRSPPRRPDSRRSRSPPPRSDSRRSHSPPHRASSRRSRSPLRRSDNRRSRSPPTRRDNRRSRSPLRRSDNRRSRSPPTRRDNRRSRSPPHCPGSRRSRSPPNSSGLHKPSSAWTPRSSPLRRLPTNRSAERSRRSCSRERLRQSPVGRRRRSRSGRRDIRIGKQDCSSPEPSRRPGSGGALAMPAAHAACARERSSTPDVMQVLGERAGQLVPAPAAAVAAARGGSCTPDAAGVLYMKAEPLREVVAASEQQQQQVQPSSCCIEPAASSEHDMECSSGGQAPPLPPPLPPEEPGGSISGGAAPLLPPVPPPLSVESLPPPPPREEPLSPPPPPPPPQPRMAASPSSTLSLPPGFFPASGSRPQQQQQQPQQQQPELPHWVPPLFLEACHKVAAERGLPILDNELEDCMDFLYGQRNCLRNAGVTIHRVCLLMEERGAVRLRITTYHAYVVELL